MWIYPDLPSTHTLVRGESFNKDCGFVKWSLPQWVWRRIVCRCNGWRKAIWGHSHWDNRAWPLRAQPHWGPSLLTVEAASPVVSCGSRGFLLYYAPFYIPYMVVTLGLVALYRLKREPVRTLCSPIREPVWCASFLRCLYFIHTVLAACFNTPRYT